MADNNFRTPYRLPDILGGGTYMGGPIRGDDTVVLLVPYIGFVTMPVDALDGPETPMAKGIAGWARRQLEPKLLAEVARLDKAAKRLAADYLAERGARSLAQAKLKAQQGIWDAKREVLLGTIQDLRQQLDAKEREADDYAQGMAAIALKRSEDLERIEVLEEALRKADRDHAQVSGELELVTDRLKTYEAAEAIADETAWKRRMDGLGDES